MSITHEAFVHPANIAGDLRGARRSIQPVAIGLAFYGVVLGVLGAVLISGGMTVIGVASIIEGVLRFFEANQVNRGNRGWTKFTIGHSAVTGALGAMTGAFGLVGLAVNVLIVRALRTTLKGN